MRSVSQDGQRFDELRTFEWSSAWSNRKLRVFFISRGAKFDRTEFDPNFFRSPIVGIFESTWEAHLVIFSQENTHLDLDILPKTELAGQRANSILKIEPRAVMAAFTLKEEDCSTHYQQKEFPFVIDCSGSMRDESKVGVARHAVLVSLTSLSPKSFHSTMTTMLEKQNNWSNKWM